MHKTHKAIWLVFEIENIALHLHTASTVIILAIPHQRNTSKQKKRTLLLLESVERVEWLLLDSIISIIIYNITIIQQEKVVHRSSFLFSFTSSSCAGSFQKNLHKRLAINVYSNDDDRYSLSSYPHRPFFTLSSCRNAWCMSKLKFFSQVFFDFKQEKDLHNELKQ